MLLRNHEASPGMLVLVQTAQTAAGLHCKDTIPFVIDSGATHHFVRDPAYASDYREDSHLVVQLADNSTITTTGVGSIPGKLAEVHVSPEFDSNLLSVPSL